MSDTIYLQSQKHSKSFENIILSVCKIPVQNIKKEDESSDTFLEKCWPNSLPKSLPSCNVTIYSGQKYGKSGITSHHNGQTHMSGVYFALEISWLIHFGVVTR